MAFYGKGQGSVRYSEIVLEVYDDATFLINNKPIEGGALALFMALRSAEEDRRNVDSDNTFKFLGGLIAKTHRKGHRTQKTYGKHYLVDVSCNTQGLGQTTICLHGL